MDYVLTSINNNRSEIITKARSGHLAPFKDARPVQTLQEQSGKTLGVREIYRPHSPRVKLHLLNWNIPPSVIQYGLCSCLWPAPWCYNIWQRLWRCVITHVCRASAWHDSMQRSMRWLTARQYCNWAMRCWSIPAFSTLGHPHTNKLHVLKTITQHVIAVFRAFNNKLDVQGSNGVCKCHTMWETFCHCHNSRCYFFSWLKESIGIDLVKCKCG